MAETNAAILAGSDDRAEQLTQPQQQNESDTGDDTYVTGLAESDNSDKAIEAALSESDESGGTNSESIESDNSGVTDNNMTSGAVTSVYPLSDTGDDNDDTEQHETDSATSAIGQEEGSDDSRVETASDSSVVNSDTITATSITTADSGTMVDDGSRLLAAQCFQCHGSKGRSKTDIDSLAGESSAELYEESLEYQMSSANSMMAHQAKGYSSDELSKIANYIAMSGVAADYAESDSDHEEEHDDD
ncbi:hypothetical protein D5085_08605 [Ectothiorhodospiraceae bacterium BW-2]|nr:hypothetical protein D5085_08605 [Ectothiorhodospiraceae bacterium BW-2]